MAHAQTTSAATASARALRVHPSDSAPISAAAVPVVHIGKGKHEQKNLGAVVRGPREGASNLSSGVDTNLQPMGARQEVALTEDYIQEQIGLRKVARERREFRQADHIRDALLMRGILLEDKGNRTFFKRVQPVLKHVQHASHVSQLDTSAPRHAALRNTAVSSDVYSHAFAADACLPSAVGNMSQDEQYGSAHTKDDGGNSVLSAPEACTLRVGNIGREISSNVLRETFGPYGEVGQIKFVAQSSCAFVTLHSIASARAAMAALDGTCICKSKPIHIQIRFKSQILLTRPALGIVPGSAAQPQRAARTMAIQSRQNAQTQNPLQSVDLGVRHNVEEYAADTLPSVMDSRAGIAMGQKGALTHAVALEVQGNVGLWGNMQSREAIEDMAADNAAAAAGKLQSDVKAERGGALSERGSEGNTRGALSTDSNLLETWHALDPLNASRTITRVVGGVAHGHDATFGLQESQMDTESLVGRYNKSLLGKALLAFEGYAQSEHEKVIGIQRAMNSPKTATIFEKWKQLPCLSDLRDGRDENLKHSASASHGKEGGGALHGAIGQGIKKQLQFNAETRNDCAQPPWPSVPPLVGSVGVDAVFSAKPTVLHPMADTLGQMQIPLATPHASDAVLQQYGGLGTLGSGSFVAQGYNAYGTSMMQQLPNPTFGVDYSSHMFENDSKRLSHGQMGMAPHGSMLSVNMNGYAASGYGASAPFYPQQQYVLPSSLYSGGVQQDIGPPTQQPLWWNHQNHYPYMQQQPPQQMSQMPQQSMASSHDATASMANFPMYHPASQAQLNFSRSTTPQQLQQDPAFLTAPVSHLTFVCILQHPVPHCTHCNTHEPILTYC